MLKKIPLITIITFILFACSTDKSSSITGEWSGKDTYGSNQKFVFHDNGKCIWKILTERSDNSFYLKYTVDISRKPWTIDIYGFENGPLEGKTVYGIFEIDGNKLKIDAEIGDSSSIRPQKFTDQSVIYKRLEN